jgi:hypothetical protein
VVLIFFSNNDTLVVERDQDSTPTALPQQAFVTPDAATLANCGNKTAH